MTFFSLEPFIPSGENFNKSKQLFQELGFKLNWEQGMYAGFEKDGSKFILQHYNNKPFAENMMISVRVNNVTDFLNMVKDKKLVDIYGIRITEPVQQPYGKEVNLIDPAGVCWHFIE
jgi:predicted lactoylglutathione lyase